MREYKIDKFKMNEHFPVNTLLLARGAIVAQEKNFFKFFFTHDVNEEPSLSPWSFSWKLIKLNLLKENSLTFLSKISNSDDDNSLNDK